MFVTLAEPKLMSHGPYPKFPSHCRSWLNFIWSYFKVQVHSLWLYYNLRHLYKICRIYDMSAYIMVIIRLIFGAVCVLNHILRSQFVIMTLVLELSVMFKFWYVSDIVDACWWNTCNTYSRGTPSIQFRANYDIISVLGFSTVICAINRLPLQVPMASVMLNPQRYTLHSCTANPVHYLVLLRLHFECSRSHVLSLTDLWYLFCMWLRIRAQPVMAPVVRVEPCEMTLIHSKPELAVKV